SRTCVRRFRRRVENVGGGRPVRQRTASLRRRSRPAGYRSTTHGVRPSSTPLPLRAQQLPYPANSQRKQRGVGVHPEWRYLDQINMGCNHSLKTGNNGSCSAALDGGVLAAVVAAALDGIENGRLEALADDISVQ